MGGVGGEQRQHRGGGGAAARDAAEVRHEAAAVEADVGIVVVEPDHLLGDDGAGGAGGVGHVEFSLCW